MLSAVAAVAAVAAAVAASGAAAASSAVPRTAAAEADRIAHLPGFEGKIPFEQFGGYLPVDGAAGPKSRNLFYWFVEAQNNPETAPLVLWLQGGPGCSSLLGLMTENGPFHPEVGGQKVYLNKYSWNRNANVLYLEAPSGVGFSYSKDKIEYTTGDKRTADDNYAALQLFFQRHPNMNTTKSGAARPFYISGESYGGHYVPDLAARVLEGNAAGGAKINLGGFFLGNPLCELGPNYLAGMWPTLSSHAIISAPTEAALQKECANFPETNAKCDAAQAKVNTDLALVNPYDLIVPVCLSKAKQHIARAYAPHMPHLHTYANAQPGDYDPCMDTYAADFLNRNDVKVAIHADPTITWQECSNALNYSMADVGRSMLPYYQNFFAKDNLRIVIYSGDADSICPYMATTNFVSKLNRPITEDWTMWTSDETKQLGGFLTKYDKYSLLTVHNAGHMVPEFQPQLAYQAFTNFLAGKLTNN